MQTRLAPDHQNLRDCKLQFEVIPLGLFGAQVVGFKFDREVSEDQLRALRESLVEHKMLLFREHSLTPDEQISFTRLFGDDLHECSPRLRYLPEHPQIFRLTNRPGEGNENTGKYWHADGHFFQDPSPVSVMHIVNATKDGATLVTDSIAAYDRLPEIAKDGLSRLAFRDCQTGVAHPIVRKHPLTSRIGLYVNLNATAIDGYHRPVPLINNIIHKHLSEPGTFYAHHWQPGDTIVVDNFSTAHRGTASDPANLRVMHRTTVTGPSVWWRK